MRMSAVIRLAALAMFGFAFSTFSAAAQSYPSRPITFVVPYGPGGNADLAARSLAEVARKYFKTTIIVTNHAGAGGMIASRQVIDAPRDGYTLLIARVGSQAVAPALDPKVTYAWDDFTFLGLLEVDPYVCVVGGNSPIKTYAQLVDALKKHPGAMSYATTGNFDASAVFPIKIMLGAGLNKEAAVKVPYKSAAETVTSILSRQTSFTCNGVSPYTGNIRAGKLRGLVVSTHDRVPEIPDVPTAAEVGVPDLQAVLGWSALYGPPGLPADVVKKWTEALAHIKNDPEWSEQPKKRGSMPDILGPQETKRFAEDQYKTYKALAPLLAAH